MTPAVILQIVAGLFGLLTSWVTQYNSAASVAGRKQKEITDDDEALRKACLELDAAAITMRIDNILHPAQAASNRVTKQ